MFFRQPGISLLFDGRKKSMIKSMILEVQIGDSPLWSSVVHFMASNKYVKVLIEEVSDDR